MDAYLIKNAQIVNEGKTFSGDVWIKEGRIEKISDRLSPGEKCHEIDAEGQYLLPGVIDDQVHFREPGLTHKAAIATESRAAVAGGVTSFMEMPNTKPPTVTQKLLEEKRQIARQQSVANFSFYMGATNDNLEEVLKTDFKKTCGVKVFMGSSTGNMLVDEAKALEGIFSQTPALIATHCEDEATIRENEKFYRQRYGEDVPPDCHPLIRSEEACYLSSSRAVGLAEQHNARLHVLHITTADELLLFSDQIPLAEKRITAEACVHHLWFDSEDYSSLGMRIKCNPAIKEAKHKEALLEALLDDRLDVIATDHAPHTMEEKYNNYFKAPSGMPLVQHGLYMMLQFYHQGKIALEKVVEKMCHAPAICFQVANRGFICEGYHADLLLVNLNQPWKVEASNLLYKCGWSPLEGKIFNSTITHVFVSGQLAFAEGKVVEGVKGQALRFERV